ncbi:MAG TPA: DoxX family protein [Acidobacteriota bacterium]|nr:DoxX family protein [Acidobacteriota bacterium]
MGAKNIIAWILCVLLGLFFIGGAGFAKLSPSDEMVDNFRQWGYEPWFATFTGVIEILGGLLLLIPAAASYGGLVIAGVMVGAVYTHISTGIGSPVFPGVLLIAALVCCYLRLNRAFGPLGALAGRSQ